MNDANARQQIVDSIKNNNNVLVTVSTNPSVDELSAALGLTILIDNLGKRGTAVVSGKIPPAIDFLEPGKTFEHTTDSLRDFIIALDKEKADHLRYKVDGDVVKIFITPYRTQLSEKDLEFSLGDYNVELVIALGVQDQDHLDKALDSHGAILHDATVVTILSGPQPSNLGSVNWQDAEASSLCEMIVTLSEDLKSDKPLLDQQVSTAFLTGIVSATDRFSNNHTTSRAMTMAAQLMAAGANQQLIAAKLEEAHEIGPNSQANSQQANTDGTTSLAEGAKPAKLKGKSDSAVEQADNSLFIPINHPQPEEKVKKDAEPTPSTKSASGETAEQALARELADVAPPAAPVSAANLGEELAKASAEQAAAPVAPQEQLSPMPPPPKIDFESLLPGAQPPSMPPLPQEGIQNHSDSGYIASQPTLPQEAPDQPVDPFAKPLISPTLPALQPDPLFEAGPREPQIAHSITPAHAPSEIEYEESPIPNDPAAVASVPDFAAMNPTGLASGPAAPVNDPMQPPAPMPTPEEGPSLDNLPPLPPLPDLSAPPPPPDFTSQDGQLPPPPAPGTPPATGQFTLPGQ